MAKIYHEVKTEFVRCDQIDSKNIHDSKLIDGVCALCIELYEDVKDDVESQVDGMCKDSLKGRSLFDYFEVENSDGDFPRILKFGVILE